MRKLLTLFSLCSLIALFSCTAPAGVDVTEHFDSDHYYYRLEVGDGMNVVVSDNVDDIVITADENVMAKIEVKFSSGTLKIRRKDFAMAYINTADVWIPYNPDLKEVKVSYDSEFHALPEYGIQNPDGEVMVKVDARSKFYGYLLADEIVLDINDYSYADIEFDAYSNMSLRMEDHSDADLEGYANTVQLVMRDHSELKKNWNHEFYAFMCNVCYGSMDEYCEAYIDCESEIDMDLTNYCYLYYTSDPYIGDSSIDGTSDFVYGGY